MRNRIHHKMSEQLSFALFLSFHQEQDQSRHWSPRPTRYHLHYEVRSRSHLLRIIRQSSARPYRHWNENLRIKIDQKIERRTISDVARLSPWGIRSWDIVVIAANDHRGTDLLVCIQLIEGLSNLLTSNGIRIQNSRLRTDDHFVLISLIINKRIRQ